MDVPDDNVLDVDLLPDDGSEDEGEALPSSDFYPGPGSTPTSCASSPRGEEPASPHAAAHQPAFFHHQGYTRPFFTAGRRGPGRPRKEGPKLTREGKIVRRYRGNPGSLRGAKRHRGSRDDSLEDMLEEDDFTMPPAPEEPPYMPEKWPGKVCALCNLSERSQLGQGEMRQIPCNVGDGDGSTTPVVNSGGVTPTSVATPSTTPTTPLTPGLVSPPPELVDPNQHPLAVPLSRRQKAFGKCKTPLYNMEHTDELSIIGHIESLELPAVVSSGNLYVHRCCLDFTPPFQDQAPSSDEDKEFEESRVRGIVTTALTRKCAFCTRHGASIPCKISCNKFFHWPCILASGGFIDFPSKSVFCKDHLFQVPLLCSGEVECRTCHSIGDLANLMTCVTCGAHHHGTCVGLAQLPGVRSGWSCRSCRVCQVCRGEAAGGAGGAGEARAIACEHCDKLYHAACLRPVMATVPKYGWKCKCCRVCSDCGARSPGAGPSSRWHAHYTVCDSCYQQRNKGSCCPLCRRAYRAAAYRDMIRCTLCKRYVHGMCDPEAEPVNYRLKKDQNPSYEYCCPICKTQMPTMSISKSGSFEEDSVASTSQDSSFGDENSQSEQDPLAMESKPADVGLGKGKPFTVSSKVAKKKISGYKLKGGFPAAAKLGFQKRQRSIPEFGRKRGSKPKMRGVFGVPGLGLQRPQAPDNKTPEDDPGVENKLVLCSSKDKFVLTQDLCVMCGAVGTDSEGCLIACAQCGQTYHPYCVNIKVSAVIVTLGWRCLDCTVCEGCGNRGDDTLLLLCEDCDTAWHTYCARPPLAEVPRGAWRCERCRRCRCCGTRHTPLWCDNYTECAPCASLVMCCVCSEPYSDGELIIQCEGCDRWLHAACDHIRSEHDAETCCTHGYKCVLCRGRDVPPPHIPRSDPTPALPASTPRPAPRPTLLSLGLAGEYYIDDVCLSQRGAHHMKQLEAELGITHTRRKRRFKNETAEKDAVVQNNDVEMPDDAKPDSTADVKEEPGAAPNPNYKEGILWNASNDGPPPEGFTLYTTESGLTVLRRKRQRNLNKLGIGGFVVRQRQATIRAQADEEREEAAGESPSNKRKPRRKPRSKLMEQFPPYMQEAFFGKELLEPAKPAVSGNPAESPGGTLRPATPEGYRELRDFKVDFDNSDSEGEDVLAITSTNELDSSYVINLNQEEIEVLTSLKPKEEKEDGADVKVKLETDECPLKHTEDSTALKNAILGPQPAEPEPGPGADPAGFGPPKTDTVSEAGGSSQASTISPKDELSLLGMNLDAMVRDSLPDMDSNDVDEIFKGVLTDDSQESQESSVSYVTSMPSTPYQQRPQLQSPMDAYASPYHNDFGNSNSALSPLFSEGSAAGSWGEQPSAPPSSYNQRSTDKMRADESLGSAATISAVLYANTNHPEWKTEFPNWVDRCKQILKKWRALPSDQKSPYLQRARDNRSAIRMKKAQQTGGAESADSPAAVASVPSVASATSATPSAVAVAAVTAVTQVRAPNVTVTAGGLLEADAHIRVLTPSEIMRTLPRLPAPAPAHTPTTPAPAPAATHTRPLKQPSAQEQERACGQQRSAREAEQERQWKHLQQQRQQQTQQQQQIIHDQRMQAAMQRLRAPDGSTSPAPAPGPAPVAASGTEAPRSAFPAARFLHCAGSEDINRQLRDLLQRHPDKMWPQQGEGLEGGTGPEGAQFRPPLPVAMRPRHPMMPAQRPEQHLIMQQRIVSAEGQMQQNMQQQQHAMEAHKTNVIVQSNSASETKTESTHDSGADEMDMGDMDKLEQDAGNIGEVGDILTGLGGEDDEELLESLTAEIGEQFNILEYADPELAALDDTSHILDGLELADEHEHRHAKRDPPDEPENPPDKMYNDLQKSVKNIETTKPVKTEGDEVKQEVKQEPGPGDRMGTGYGDGVQRVITPNQQIALQNAMQAIKSEVKLEGDEKSQQRVFMPFSAAQPRMQLQHHPQSPGVVQRAPQFASAARPQLQFPHHNMHFAQGSSSGSAVGQSAGVTSTAVNTQSIVNAMTAQVNAALAAGRCIAPGTRLVGADGAVGIVRADRTVALSHLPYAATGGQSRAPPPPPYPGTLRQPQPPPPPYPQQEQPLLLEELLEQEKREQERDGGEWGGAGAAVAAAAPASAAVPLYGGAAPPAPPPPPERPATEAEHHARLLYEQWLKQFNAYAADQQRYYELEVQKLRKIRKSLNSKQRQLRKSGNELLPNDAAELLRVSTEQQALQKHLDAARKQARQHSSLIQEYETKQRQQNPQLVQQTVITQQIATNQSAFSGQGMGQQLQQQSMGRAMQLGLGGGVLRAAAADPRAAMAAARARTLVIEQAGAPLVRTLAPFAQRAPAPRPARPSASPLHIQPAASPLHSLAPQSPLHHLASPLQSPLHSQQSPLHHTAQSPLHSQQSPLHAQQSPLHSQSPMTVQQTTLPQQSPMHPQQSPIHPQQSPMHPQQSPMHQQSSIHQQQTSIIQQQSHQQQSPMHQQQSPMHQQQTSIIQQQSPMHQQQTTMHPQQSPLHPPQSPLHPQQSPMHPQQSPMHTQQSQNQMSAQHSPMHSHQSPMHSQQSPMHMQQSPMHMQQSPMHTQQSPMQSSMSPQHFLQQLQAQRTSPQLPTPSRSPQIYQQTQIQSPVASNSPQMQNTEYTIGRFSRPAAGCSPLPTRFARPPQHQQGLRVGGAFGGRQQTSPLGSPQPMPSPGNPANEIARQQMAARQQYSPMGGAPASPSVARSPLVARTPTPGASPAASPAPDHLHGGGASHAAPFPPGYHYSRPGLRGGAPPWPTRDDNRPHITKVSILKRRRFGGKTAAGEEVEGGGAEASGGGSGGGGERIATEEDFEQLIDGGAGESPPRTETATKTVAVISLAAHQPHAAALQHYKLVSGAHVAQHTVASVSIDNHTISVPVLKSLAVPPPHHRPALATSAAPAAHHYKQHKIVKTIEKPMALALGAAKLSSLAVSHDATLPAKIFQDEAGSPEAGEAGAPRRDLDIETEISRHTELPHALRLAERPPRADIKSPDPVPERIPDNIMEGDDDDPPAPAAPPDHPPHTIKAIANQTKTVPFAAEAGAAADLAQDSVQISIPSPTPSQERYLDDMTMCEHAADPPDAERKRVERFEDMLCMFDKIDGAEAFPRAGAGAAPQLSPLSQPADLTSTMADVSQQLRTIMSSLGTAAPKPEPTDVIRKAADPTAPTQVNFENLLPSSKVEVAASRPPAGQRAEKPPTPGVSEPLPMSAAQALGSRVNTLSTMGQMRKSPTASPVNSPIIQSPMMKSPAQSPLVGPPFNPPEEPGASSAASQVIQMPALSRIQCSSTPPAIIHTNSTITTSINTYQKSQVLPTSILGHTLLQPTRQMSTSSLPTSLHFNQQSISTSQPPALVMTSRPVIGNKDIPPNVTVRTHAIVGPGMSQIPGKQTPGPINFINTSKLLHTQLTSPLKRSKSTDEAKSEIVVGHIQPTKRHSVEAVVVKSEPMETDDGNAPAATADAPGGKMQQGAANQRNDESQNVLLKQLLQTTTAAATSVPARTMTIQRTAPALGTIPSLEAQLARPSIPPPTLALTHDVDISKSSPRHMTAVNTSFASRPIQTSVPTSSISPMSLQNTTQSLMDVRKPPVKIITKEESHVLQSQSQQIHSQQIHSQQTHTQQIITQQTHTQQVHVQHTPMPESSPTMKTLQMYPMSVDSQQINQAIKKEIAPPQQSPVHRPFTPMDVKKELLDESSQQSATSGVSTASDQGKLDQPIKEEFPEGVPMDSASDANAPETPSEAKKRKRREYQQKKRKQMQMNMKAAAENSLNATNAKKRPRKGSRYEEDYDTFIDNLMTQLRLLPPMQIQEPALTTNFAVCPLFGSGDLTKLKNKDYDLLKGDLTGEFGNAKIPNVADYYNTKPFGDEEPLPEKPPASTQRGFYDQEFQPIMFDEDPEDRKLDFICKERDTDTPDSIVSCSSPECSDIESFNRFPGLKLIDDDEEDEDSDSAGRMSPIIPLMAPVPIRVKPVSLYQTKEEDDNQKSLNNVEADPLKKVKMEDSPGSTESNENVTVTLTLTSGAAEDILGVLKELAGILHIPPPTAYQIVERTATPPSHKLGLYRSKGKDGKEGTPIDIQSILNGAAKFCRHCDVVILDSVVRAKASEFPLLSANKGNAGEILCDSDSELYFCSTQCYERFAWRPTNIILDGKSKTPIKEDTKSDTDPNLSKERDDFDTASTESMETDDLDIKPDIKDEKMDLSFMDSLDNDELMKEVGDDVSVLDEDLKNVDQDEKSNQSVDKEKYKGVRYKAWSPGCIGPPVKYKRPTDRELTELVFRTGVAIMPVTNEDSRRCEFCGIQGDGVADGVSRLLNCDVDRWVHLNCALWSEGVYETVSGALMNVETAMANGSNATCAVCRRLGATVRCFKVRCGSVYHLGCAVKENCVFYKNKTAFCASHAPKNEKDNELTTLSVARRVYVSRDEQRQVASVMLHCDTNHLIRVGGLIFLAPGHLLPHQLPAFTTPNYIYPIGYKIVRFYWSMVRANGRCRYLCWISEEEGRPRFHVRAQDDHKHEASAPTPRAAWATILDAVAALRESRNEEGVLKLWPNYVTGEDLFGLTEPAIVRVLESLPGIETLPAYRFKFGRSALLEGGLAVNPSGCARAEGRSTRTWRRAAPRAPAPAALPAAPASADLSVCPYTKQFIHTKSSQYKRMKMEWRNNVYLARSKIQGLGLYAARDLEKHTMVIEYIGEIIRSELSEIREKKYEAKNRGTYMFRLDERRVVDATLSGGLARYINHSCQPNCVAETIDLDRHLRIIIFTKRRIARGEELAYDYKFDIEDDAHKIMCMCGAPNCRKWMN